MNNKAVRSICPSLHWRDLTATQLDPQKEQSLNFAWPQCINPPGDVIHKITIEFPTEPFINLIPSPYQSNYLNENSTFQILRRGSRFDAEQTVYYFLIERSAVGSGQGKHLDSINLLNLGHHQGFRDLQQLDHEIFEAITSGLVHLQIDFRYVGLKSRNCDIMVEVWTSSGNIARNGRA